MDITLRRLRHHRKTLARCEEGKIVCPRGILRHLVELLRKNHFQVIIVRVCSIQAFLPFLFQSLFCKFENKSIFKKVSFRLASCKSYKKCSTSSTISWIQVYAHRFQTLSSLFYTSFTSPRGNLFNVRRPTFR